MEENSVMVDLTQGTIECELLEEVKTGILHGWNKLRFPDGSVGYIHSKFCYRKAESSKDFLKSHWDEEKSMLKVEYVDEYYSLFRKEAEKRISESAERIKPPKQIDTRISQENVSKPKREQNNTPKPEHKNKQYTELSLFDF